MMPISLVGATNSRRGVSLLELLIVVTLIALVAGLSYPSVASGLDALRLRSASNAIVGFLNSVLDHADRRQQVVEIRISPKENSMVARAADSSFVRRLDMPDMIQIVSVWPTVQPGLNDPRRFLIYPGGTVPAIGVEIATREGHRRIVSVDPMTGVPQSKVVNQ
jgi:prepilin-type N-terminal cleavage/methylation domain-containing protein